MEHFLRIVGKSYLIAGALELAFAACVFSLTDAWFTLTQVLGDLSNIRNFPASTLFLASLAVHASIVSIPTLVSGLGIMKHQRWSRDLAVVSAVIQLAGIPFGTALGVFALWALFLNASGSYFHQEKPPA